MCPCLNIQMKHYSRTFFAKEEPVKKHFNKIEKKNDFALSINKYMQT